MVGKRIKAPGLVLGVLLMTIGPSVAIGPVPVAIAQTNPATPKAEAQQLLQQGIQQFQTGQFEAALQSWQKALTIYRAIKDQQGEGDALGNLGAAYNVMGNYPKAIEYHQQSLAIAQQNQSRRSEGNILGNLGNAYLSLGDYPEAIEYYEKSLAIAREIKDKRGEGNFLGNLGIAYNALGNYPKAIAYQEQSLAITRQLKDRRGEGAALGNLSNAYDALGNYPKAIAYQEQSLAIARQLKDPLGEGAALGSLGNAYNALGNYPKAIAYQEQSLAIAQQLKDPLGASQALGSLGNAYNALGNYPKAIEYHEKSLAIKRALKDRRGEGISLGNLGNTYYLLGNYSKAIEYQEQSLAIAQQLKDRRGEGVSLGSLGNAYLTQGNYSKAIAYYEQSLTINREIKDRKGESISRSNLGLTLLKLNRLPEAESNLRSAIAIQESLRTGLTDRNKISIADTQKDAYINLQKVLITQKKSEAALEIAERGRARALVELLASRFNYESQVDLQKTIQAPNINAIRQIAKTQNATLVQYSIVSSEQLYIWVIKPTGEITFRSTQLDSSQPLAQLVSSSRSEMGVRGRAGIQIARQPTPSDQPNPLAKLYQSLIAPIAQDLPTDPKQRVIFLPQGELFLVPFAALPDAQNRPLIERHTISTAPSIQTLALTQTLAQRPKNKGGAVIVGDPTMPIYKDEPLQPLPAARQEAIAISQQLNTPPLIGAQATKATVLQQMPNARLLHFATHGLLDPVQGDIPGAIALTPSGQDNGFLSAAEIFNLKLNADLVVLSACDTGRGEITGDGVVGLSRSFIAAGAPSVIVSLWAVNDQSTSELMQEFYRQLKQQPDKAQALRQAMLITKQRYPDPSHWAAFTLVGEAQ
ncbi:CHAT domain-containing tetratricopeptide repeat protein [Alkalinema sp. FACHB-956]|uniref:CHAT domain-containing protein n=1 Tax=Alkalinema sp. FACHB-956 TaxID=2692768 RepID=UPI001688F76C|nr:CHAT domain-containing tetratricopeptide repeat protein [Alkalinema sp. FACHB-956]MBD2328732.1 tetratricopeptide repeat protein [Alkalinema sp. FACHB-956]